MELWVAEWQCFLSASLSWNRHKGGKSDDRPNQQSLLILVRNGLKEHTTIYYLQQKSEIFGPLKLLLYPRRN